MTALFPQAPAAHRNSGPLFAAWAASASLHQWSEPASEYEIALAENLLGRALPPIARAIYAMSNGLTLFGGSLNIFPLREGPHGPGGLTTGAVGLADQLREYEWSIPEELVLFGGDGSEDHFGFWLPATYESTDAAPVIELGGTGPGLAVVGTDFPRFLRCWTANYLIAFEADMEALDAIHVPRHLRDRAADDDLFRELCVWADPDLPDQAPDPYLRPIAVESLRRTYGGEM